MKIIILETSDASTNRLEEREKRLKTLTQKLGELQQEAQKKKEDS